MKVENINKVKALIERRKEMQDNIMLAEKWNTIGIAQEYNGVSRISIRQNDINKMVATAAINFIREIRAAYPKEIEYIDKQLESL